MSQRILIALAMAETKFAHGLPFEQYNAPAKLCTSKLGVSQRMGVAKQLLRAAG